MKTEAKKIDFSKQTILELNDHQLLDVKGGSTPVCAFVGSVCLSIAISNMIFDNDDPCCDHECHE